MHQYRTIPRFSIDYRFGDLITGAKTLFRGSAPSPQAMGSLTMGRPAFWASSGRQALWLILKALRLKEGSGVAVPLYADYALSEAIQRAGYSPVFVDVRETTMTMDPVSLHRVRHRIAAVVAVHFFGHVADVQDLSNAAGAIPIIEDTVHAPFSYFGGSMAGTTGVACFYSFASSKPWPAGGGGLAVINEPRLAMQVHHEMETLKPPSCASRGSNLVAQAMKAALFHRSVYGLLGRPIRHLTEPRRPLEPVLNDRKIQPHQASIALRQMDRLAERIERQRRHSLRMLEKLASVSNVVFPKEPSGARYNYHLFPVLLQTAAERDAVASEMLRFNVDVSCMYRDITERMRRFGYSGGCPVSESVASRMLTLPNYPELSDEDIEIVASTFIRAVNHVRSRYCTSRVGSHSEQSQVASTVSVP